MPRLARSKKKKKHSKKTPSKVRFSFVINFVMVVAALLFGIFLLSYTGLIPSLYNQAQELLSVSTGAKNEVLVPPQLDKVSYNKRMLALAHRLSPITELPVDIIATSTLRAENISSTTVRLWPVKTVYPNYGAILPFNRVVSYYGNFYSKGMGVLGEYPPKEVLTKLMTAVDAWKKADPSTPVIPAIDYIAVTAQRSSGKDGKYRLRMPDSQIEKAIHMVNEVNGLVFLDVQVGLSTLPQELPYLRAFLKMPQVELAIDPEFSMVKSGRAPGTVIGTFDASNINYAAQYLAELVREYHLPPKILVVHRFTQDMVTNYQNITPLPEVQIVMDMDGWGVPSHKKSTYRDVITRKPVQFAGFKLFYKNDARVSGVSIMTPNEVLMLTPQPSFIQYQ